MKPHIAIAAVILVALIGVIASGASQLYLRYPYFDKVMHFAGGFAIAWLTIAVLARDIRRVSGVTAVLLVVGVTMIVGVVWEMAEYLSNAWFIDATDGLRATIWRYFHGGDLRDSLLDLGADTLGALVLTAFLLPMVRKLK